MELIVRPSHQIFIFPALLSPVGCLMNMINQAVEIFDSNNYWLTIKERDLNKDRDLTHERDLVQVVC